MVCIGLVISIAKKTASYLSKSDEEKIAIAKTQLKETILKMITEAEINYEEWNKAGSIKRSQVIEEIYLEYPVLSKVADQNTLIQWIDEEIDNALKTLREIVALNG